MTNPRRRLLPLLLLALPAASSAQDAHYWTDQFGARATLLGGVVIGSKTDLSNVYYNPGAIALIPDPSLHLGSGAFEFTRIGIGNAAADGKDISTLVTRSVPSLFAVSFGSKWRAGHDFAFSVLTRRDFDLRLDTAYIASRDAAGGPPGQEHIAGEGIAQHSVRDTWVGISWSHSPRSGLGVGVTQFVAVQSQNTRGQSVIQAVDSGGTGGAAVLIHDISFWNVRLLWKAGLLLERPRWTAGLTVTTPSLDVVGSGKITYNESLVLPASSVLGADYQEGVDAHNRSPLSIGLGGSRRLGNTTIHVSGEWFDRVREYRVLDTAPWNHQTGGDVREHSIVNRLNDVFNFGVGVEHAFRPQRKVYVSFITDRSAAEEKEREDISISTWNIYHVSAGGELGFSFVDLTFGASFGFGSSEVDLQDLGDPGLENGQQSFDVTYRRLKVLIGLVFPFES